MHNKAHHPLTDAVVCESKLASALYNRLILVVGKSNTGKSQLLSCVAAELCLPCVNVGTQLSHRLLDVLPRQRVIHLQKFLADMLPPESSVVVLDNTEILFEKNLQNDPLTLLQSISRNTTIVAAWAGEVSADALVYATPGHPEYRHYPAHELLIFDLNTHSTVAPESTH